MFNLGYPIKPKLPPRPIIIKRPVTTRSTIGKRYAPLKEFTSTVRSGNKIITTTKSSRTLPSGLVQRASSQRVIAIRKAKKGYHGYVDQPTKFLVGEDGRERVDIYPIRKRQKRMGMLDDFDFSGGLRAGDFF